MSHFLGEFDCKLDAKGRMMIPSSLKKQLPEAEREGLVINRGFEKHLVIYTKKEWDNITEELSKLNAYEKKSRDFIRYFTRGATELSLDSANRILFPKARKVEKALRGIGMNKACDDFILSLNR